MYYYILNPTAARAKQAGFESRLRESLNQLGISGELVKTTGTGDATKLTKLAIEKGCTTIVAVGGDGTVNEVVNGISREGVAIGIIPAGNSNRIAAALGITTWQQACTVLAARRLTPYSLIAAGQSFFLSTLTLGFDTDLDKNIDTAGNGLAERLRHAKQSWGHARRFQSLHCRIQVDNQYELECNLFSLSVTNQKFINPLSDNRLIISLSDRPSRRQLGSYIWQLAHQNQPLEDIATTRFLANRVVIETDPPTGIMVDGHLVTRTPIAIRLTERRIRFITERQGGTFRPGDKLTA